MAMFGMADIVNGEFPYSCPRSLTEGYVSSSSEEL